MIEIDGVRKLNNPNNIAITKHGKDRLFERHIMIDDITQCIKTGEIIKQYIDDMPLPSCLISGVSSEQKPLHIVVSCDGNFIYLITAYYPDPKQWSSDYKKRREQ